MDTIPQLNTWQGLFWLLVVLIIIYWSIKLILLSLKQFAKRNLYNKQLVLFFEKIILFFKPIAITLLLLDFISINYITHTMLLIIVGVFGFSQIKNYIHGVFLKSNPMVSNGAIMQVGNNTGEIKQFLPLGLKLDTEDGEQFINYITITSNGFAIKSNKTSVIRQTLYLKTEKTPDQILDLLFNNPIINYNQAPIVSNTENNQLKLLYTIEDGASTKELINFLEDNNIQTNLNNTN